MSLEPRLKAQALALGFELAGIAPAAPADSFQSFHEWLDQGYAGEMSYLERHAEARRHPASILPQVRSVVMVGMNYRCEGGSPVASYARGADYHDVLRERLKRLLAWVREQVPGCHGRAVVDTAPLLERDFARRAGLGWVGKNTMLLSRRLGSFFFLGGLLLDVELQPDPPHATSHCGTCTACLEACPTEAFVAPGRLDARRCISYLTIELRGPIPEPLREPLGSWLFGCDICQDVCPWNRKAPPGREPSLYPRPDLEAPNLIELLGLSEADFRRRFHGTALLRPGRAGLLRNAALVLGNTGDTTALPALEQAAFDADPLVREAAVWARERLLSRLSPRGFRELSSPETGSRPTSA